MGERKLNFKRYVTEILNEYASPFLMDMLREIKEALIKGWQNIPLHHFKNLIESMPNHITVVLRARRGNTKY